MQTDKILLVDIDDTIFLYDHLDPTISYKDRILEKYKQAKPDVKEIKELNRLKKEENYKILIFTGRNWDKYDFTKKQLDVFGVNYDAIIMGKPQGMYLDKTLSIKTLSELK